MVTVRWKHLLALSVIPALVVTGAAAAGDERGGGGDRDRERARLDQRARIGLEIAPVELDLEGKDLTMVGRGSYIVNAQGGCNDCHTSPPYAPGGNPFMGEPERINAPRYLAGGMAFGPVISANLTPDEDGRPGGLTGRQFVQLMRTGIDPEDGHVLQVMPWPVYGKMTDHDLRSVYEYLSAIPSVRD